MPSTKIPTWIIALVLVGCGHTAIAADDKPSKSKTENGTVKSVVNEIGKGIDAVGKVVGPAVGKAEKTVRDTGKDDTEKRGANRKQE